MRKLLLVSLLLCSGCTGFAHLTHQLVVHAPEVAAWGAAGYVGNQGLQAIQNLDNIEQRAEKRLDP